MTTPTEEHWDAVWAQRAPEEVAWFEPVPSTLPIVLANSTPADSVLDVGAGTSSLATALVEAGYSDVSVLDVSRRALSASRAAMWQHTEEVDWIHADVTSFVPRRTWRAWHDRAVFHFLTDERAREGYRAAASSAVVPGGVLIVATFGPDGPDRCAGLPVVRFDVGELAAEFAPDFEFVDGAPLTPPSPQGDQRPYVAVVLRRR
jgi:SAM-dependent methyltransferase